MALEQQTIVREKETFRWEVVVNVDGHDTRFYVKADINYERQTYKIKPIITLVHGWDEDAQEQFMRGITECRERCMDYLARYRDEAGIGEQGDLFGSPGEA